MHLQTDTGSQGNFARVPTISHSRNAFSIAEKHISTMQFDKLYPMWHKFIYPGDTLAITQKSLARLQTQISVLYDDLYFDAHAWFVPMRLIQTNWARFQFNAQPAGPSQDNSALTTPSIDIVDLGAAGFLAKSNYDYFGYPTAIDFTTSLPHINNYPCRALHLIWNENYRDQNIQNPLTVDLDDGPDDPDTYMTLLSAGKRHDKFTSCLIAPQKGTSPLIPISGTTVPVELSATTSVNQEVRLSSDHSLVLGAAGDDLAADSGGDLYIAGTITDSVVLDPNGTLIVNLGLTGTSMAALRQSVAVQHLLEADARGGTRDVESIQHRWGVTVPDFRLQRPEYVGGTTWSFDGHIVPQTSETATTPQAGLKQFSQTLNAFNINHSFVEHGIFMILVRARSNITYQQGLSRELSYETRFDFYQPEFANLGEVAVLNKEIFAAGTTGASGDDATFGYQEYAYELRYSENRVSGEMRSNYATPLDSRHMATDFVSLPTLSPGFIESATPISRNIYISAATADPIQFNTFVQGKIARTLPMYSIPGLDRL